jgi:hypothetical protein
MDTLRTAVGRTTLALSVILVVLASSLVFVVAEPQSVMRPVTTTTTVTATVIMQSNASGISFASLPASFPDSGDILVVNIGYFAYMKIATSGLVPRTNTQTFQNVTFTYVEPKATITGAVCDAFNANFQVDGSSENLRACSYPTNFETVVVFSKHVKPTAGLMLVPFPGSVYLLVSI